jgi:hypothetical protein
MLPVEFLSGFYTTVGVLSAVLLFSFVFTFIGVLTGLVKTSKLV